MSTSTPSAERRPEALLTPENREQAPSGSANDSQLDAPLIDWTPAIVTAAQLTRAASPPVASRFVLHVAGDVTQSVYSFLKPATEALAADGAEQVVLMSAPRPGAAPRTFPPGVRVEAVPLVPGRQRARWSAWRQRLRELLAEHPVNVIHAHGLTPALFASWALRSLERPVRLYCSPHGSRWLGERDALSLSGQILTPLIRRLHRHIIVNSSRDARHVLQAVRVHPTVVESPVDAAYFLTDTPKSATPLIVGGVYDEPALNAEQFAQLAVLAGHGEQDVRFAWVSELDAAASQLLHAADVEVHADMPAAERASLLASAWAFLAPGPTHGHAQHIAEALASATPCVALDVPSHRDLIRDGVTGFLCRTQQEMLDRLAVLIDEPTIARAMSARAREIALERFAPDHFGPQMLRHYALDDVAAALPLSSPPARHVEDGLTRPGN